jgi:hypothetical protein
MTDEPTNPMESAPARQFFATIGVTNMADVVRWVAEPEDIEERRRRGKLAKEALNLTLDGVDHAEFNRAVRDQARRLTHGDPN